MSAGSNDKRRRGPAARPLGDLVADLVDPIVARKAGMTAGLLQAWPEVVGPRLGDVCRPEKLSWPGGRSADDPFQPAVLVVACEGAFVLRLQHDASEILARVNGFFGYPAVEKLRIVQKPVRIERPNRKPAMAPLTVDGRRQIAEITERIENPRLKAALRAYGATVLGRNGSRTPDRTR